MVAGKEYDVIVIGGGHAGCEAAAAAARCGAHTLLLSIHLDHIAQMSCNPAIGGIAKGQVVREIDALGGLMGRVTDAASIQFRMLNRKKGPAVRSPRAQCDKVVYQRAYKRELERIPGLDIHQAMAEALTIGNRRIAGVRTQFGDEFRAAAVVLATGTFLNGKLHYGFQSFPGGRAGDPPSVNLADTLQNTLGLRIGRLKTGTPPRVLAKTIDFSGMVRQDAETEGYGFSHFSGQPVRPAATRKDLPCYQVYSTQDTASAVRENLHLSPMYQGRIDGIGTRYCPSFEDKIVRFPHHEKHLLFLEPEGDSTEEYYLNGISTSLPPDVQIRMLRTIPGLEKAQIARYAYAIEYDFVFPDQIGRSLQVKDWPDLFLAGQINGTSGYEEAGGQGLIAGLNAARHAAGTSLVELPRDYGYIGVMIDDLVTKEIIEPYRLFTSRAEYRLRLRQDNADLRLCPFARKYGLLPDEQWGEFERYRTVFDACAAATRSERIAGDRTLWQEWKRFYGTLPENRNDLPGIERLPLSKNSALDRRVLEQILIQTHYEGYVEREEQSIRRMRSLERWRIPTDFDYATIAGLRNEARAKLTKVRPGTLAQAGRIDGVTPAEIALLQIHLKRRASVDADIPEDDIE